MSNKQLNLKNILKDRFNLAAALTFTILTLLIIAFWLLSVISQPHVRFFELEGQINSADFSNQRVKVFFSSPMNKDSTQNYITIEPSIDFKTAWSGNNLFIIFDTNLRSTTSYTIKFSPSFKDLYNKALSTKSITFKTKKQEFLYVDSSNNTKKIVKSDLDFNKVVLYENENIETFDAGKSYLAVITKNPNQTNSLNIINIDNKSVTTLNVGTKIIPSISFSPKLNEIAYVTQSVILRSTYAQPLEDTSINFYNIDTKETKTINYSAPGEGVTNIKYAPDGNSILYKTSQSYYQIMDVSNAENSILLGRFLADGGFNFDGSKLAFVEFDPVQAFSKNQYIAEINVERDSRLITNGDVPVLDPEYFNNSAGIIYSQRYKDLDERTKGQYRIVKDLGNNNFQVLVEDEKRSLEIPKLSFDDRYILIEGYKETDLLSFENSRSFGFQTKPQTSDLMLFDLENNKLIDLNVRGYDAMWLR